MARHFFRENRTKAPQPMKHFGNMLDMFNGYLLSNRFASLANGTGLNDTTYNMLATSMATPEHGDNNWSTIHTTSGMVNTPTYD